MQKQVLREMVKQHQVTSRVSLDRVSEHNATLRLNERAASIGFIYRHIAETINLFLAMLGTPTDVENTTIGQTDTGQRHDVGRSRELIERGYRVLHDLVEKGNEDDWLEPVDTPFFGTVPRIRLLAHTLFHTSHHAGQISLTLSKGQRHVPAADAEAGSPSN
jgi:uncharacterized damage-inducible protein DinB